MRTLYEFNATVRKVVDGDTFDFAVDLGFTVHVNIRTRLLGIDAPEVSTEAGRQVRDTLREWYPVGTPVTIRTFKASGDKYGRWLAEVSADNAPANPENKALNHLLVERGMAIYREF
jgi:micrococcal nuclease